MPHCIGCEFFKLGNIDPSFPLQIAHQNFGNCHSERSEESLIVAAGQRQEEQYRDVSTPLDMTNYWSRWRPVFRLKITRDQTCTLIEAQIRPCPLNEHEQTIAEPDQEDDVNEQPCQPRGQPAKMKKFQIRNGLVAADRGHTSFIEITKRPRLFAADHSQNVASCLAPFLHCHGRDSRQRLSS